MTAQLTEGSLFAGIMGFGLGFRKAGYRNLWAVEIEPFCQAVIRTQFPETELFADVRQCGKHNLKPVDVLTAGFPCQDLSVAGKRAGLGGARSGLFWELHRILGELRPAWFVIENVPGLFSSNEGRDFAVVLDALDELGYGLAWRVLNSQYFGVAQRRRRVFIVGRFGEPCPREVLFESESGAGDIEKDGEEGTDFAGTLAAGSHASSERKQSIIAISIVRQAISSKWAKGSSGPAGDEHHNLVAAFREQTDALCATYGTKWNGNASADNGSLFAFHENKSGHLAGAENARALRSGASHSYQFVASPDPQHQERSSQQLDAMPEMDGAVRGNDHECAPPDTHRMREFASIPPGLDSALPEGMDSARYRVLGNACTASVCRWIAERIKKCHEDTSS